MEKRIAIFMFYFSFFGIANASEQSSLQECLQAERNAVEKRAECYDVLVKELKARNISPETILPTETQAKTLAKDESTASKDDGNKKSDEDEKNIFSSWKEKEYYRFISYEHNDAVWQYAIGDENSLRVNYSFMYLFSSPADFYTKCISCGANTYFSYTGKFDFYMKTRHSSPVVNRINNPALHFRWFKDNSYIDWWDFAVEHKSNGQATDANNLDPNNPRNFGPNTTLSNYQTGNNNNGIKNLKEIQNTILDSISRTTNYFSLEGHHAYEKTNDDASLKWFVRRFDEESDVYWGKYSGKGDFTNFERVRVTYNKKSCECGIEWTVGDKLLTTSSANIWLNFGSLWKGGLNNSEFPLTFRAHFGPMNNLSNYTKSQQSYGIGLNFSR